MKRIYIVQSAYQDGPEVFTTPKKAYQFIIKNCNGISESMPPYRKFLKEIKEHIKLGSITGWALDTWDEDADVSVSLKEINPLY